MTATINGPLIHPDPDIAARLLDPSMVWTRQGRTDRLIAADGAGHLVHDLPIRADGRTASLSSRPWRVDPIPVVIDANTFRWLSLAVAERMDALEALVADVYGSQQLLRERVVPVEILASTDRYRINAVGSQPKRWLSTYCVDVALGADGAWYVVQDLTDVPPGLGYSLLDRSVMSRVVPEVMSSAGVASLSRFPAIMRRALASASGSDSPRTVVFSGGLDHAFYVDHSYLAVELGLSLVEGADLVVRQRRVWLRTLDGLEPVDVLHRCVDDPNLDPLEVAASGSIGVPGLLQAVRSGGVVLANAHGSGVIEAPALRPVLADALAALRPMEQALTELPSSRHPLARVPLASPLPGSAPDAPIVIRMFAVNDGETISVLPGGTGRVLADGDDPRFPTACVAKDVWVLGHALTPVVLPTRLPQVDFGRSVPTRAADALYWTNRSAERAEAMARTMRVVASRSERDAGLLHVGGGEWARRAMRLLSAVRRSPIDTVDATVDRFDAELSTLGDAIASEIGSLLTEAMTVREFLSISTGRVLAHLAELRASLQNHTTEIDDLDAVLSDFAALAGLWRESTVRGPAWRIGDTGRRLERCLVVLDVIDGAFGSVAPLSGTSLTSDDVEASVLEMALASCESLVAYRRRHRSDVEPDRAIDLLVHDASNPRSIAATIETLAEHAANGEVSIRPEVITAARATLSLPLPAMSTELRRIIVDAGSSVVSEWFSTPVNPILVMPS